MDSLELHPKLLELIDAYVVQALWALKKPVTVTEDQKVLCVIAECLMVE